MNNLPAPQGLYDPAFEHDACGVAFVVDMHGRKTHEMVRRGLQSLCNLDHRGATNAEDNVGDGAGILTQIPDRLFREACGFDLPADGSYAVGIAFLPRIPPTPTPPPPRSRSWPRPKGSWCSGGATSPSTTR